MKYFLFILFGLLFSFESPAMKPAPMPTVSFSYVSDVAYFAPQVVETKGKKQAANIFYNSPEIAHIQPTSSIARICFKNARSDC